MASGDFAPAANVCPCVSAFQDQDLLVMENVVGNRLRQARTARQLSLNDVAGRAKISVATLSRIERDKQGIDLGLFLTLSRILKAPPHDLLTADGDGRDSVDPLVHRIASLDAAERARLWRELTA